MKAFFVIAERPELDFEEFSFVSEPENAIEAAETFAWLNDKLDILVLEEAV